MHNIHLIFAYKSDIIIVLQQLNILGYSSVGRAAVSKTACPEFESLCPCHRRRGLCIVRDDFYLEKPSTNSRRRSSSPQKVFGFSGTPSIMTQLCGLSRFSLLF